MASSTSSYSKIKTFVQELTTVSEQRGLHLYHLLLSKTSPGDPMSEEAVARHNELFQAFIKTNAKFILGEASDFEEPVVRFSTKVAIDLGKIYKEIGEAEQVTVRQHLLLLLALMDPDSAAEAKAQLQALQVPLKPVAPAAGAPAGLPGLDGVMSLVSSLLAPGGMGGAGGAGGAAQDPTTDLFKAIADSGIVNQVVDTIKTSMADGQFAQGIQSILQGLQMPGQAGGAGAGAGAGAGGAPPLDIAGMMGSLVSALGAGAAPAPAPGSFSVPPAITEE